MTYAATEVARHRLMIRFLWQRRSDYPPLRYEQLRNVILADIRFYRACAKGVRQ